MCTMYSGKSGYKGVWGRSPPDQTLSDVTENSSDACYSLVLVLILSKARENSMENAMEWAP